MKNLKVGIKLTIAFGAILLLLIVSVLIAVIGLTSVSNGLTDFYNNSFQTVASSKEIRNLLNEAGKNMLYACLTKDEAETRSRLQTARENLSNLNEPVSLLHERYSGSQAEVESVSAKVNSVQTAFNELETLATANQTEEAFALFESGIKPAMQEATVTSSSIEEFAADSAEVTFQSGKSASRTSVIWMIVVGAASILAGGAMSAIIARNLTVPLKELESAAMAMSEGDFNAPLTYHSKDELGQLSHGMRQTTEKLNLIVSDISQVTGRMRDGDFDVHTRCEEAYVGIFKDILLSLRNMSRSVSDTLRQLSQSAEQVAAGSEQVSSGAQALSQGATEQASAVEELAATITEISRHVEQNAESAREASKQAEQTAGELETGKRQIQRMTDAMNEMNSTSSEIGKIIKTIEDIAFQTNILALNAAVEAARAGAAGKGFAVVADEVRSLASKSSEASKNTSALIENAVHSVLEGSEIANETAASLERIIGASEKTAGLVHQIAQASQEQAASIVEVTQGIDQISSVVQTNSATAEESAAASEELSGQSQLLKKLIGRFNLRKEEPGGLSGVSV